METPDLVSWFDTGSALALAGYVRPVYGSHHPLQRFQTVLKPRRSQGMRRSRDRDHGAHCASNTDCRAEPESKPEHAHESEPNSHRCGREAQGADKRTISLPHGAG